MRLWKRATGLLKDQNSLWLASLSRRTTFRNPDIEAVIIKATNHDEYSFGYEYPDRVYKWLRLSDSNIKPIVRCIANRIDKTRSWVVALKGLMLMHGVFSTKLSVIQRIGRLPFDLSNFKDGHTKLGKTWAHNTFIRAYYSYLDQKSVILFENLQERKGLMKKDHPSSSVMQELLLLQKIQCLLDLLLQIKPLAHAASVYLIVEAMECIVYEVFDIYSRFCQMVANVFKKIESSSKTEAALILKILQKAEIQGEDLALYLEFCKAIGVRNALSFTEIPQVPEEDIKYLEHIVHYGESQLNLNLKPRPLQDKAIVLLPPQKTDHEEDSRNELRTIITKNWEKFDEQDYMMMNMNRAIETCSAVSESNPFLSLSICNYTPPQMHQRHYQELPDLITF